MAELTISPDVVRDALKDFAAAYEPTGAAATEVGTVVDAADGIAHLEGLPGVMANELVTFADGTSGLALNLDEHEVALLARLFADVSTLLEPDDEASATPDWVAGMGLDGLGDDREVPTPDDSALARLLHARADLNASLIGPLG